MDDAMMETIRANARYYRLANGLSGTYIGDAIGHDASWVQQFEAGAIQKPKPADLIKLAHALGLRLSDLVKTEPNLLLYLSPEEHRTGMENLEKIRHRRGYPRDSSACPWVLVRVITTKSSMATEISASKPGGKSQMPCLWICGH